MAYIYCADIYCDDCGQAIKVDLDKARRVSEYPRSEDSEHYPVYAGDGGGESDCPQHCGHCHKPLDNPLTSDGVNYVLETIREDLQEAVDKGRETTWDRIMPAKGTGEDTEGFRQTWAGKRHVEIVRGWAKQLSDYSLEKDEAAIVALFLELSE